MTGDVMKLNTAVRRLDATFPELLRGLVDLAELGKDQIGAKARLVELVRDDFEAYVREVGEIVTRLEYLNKNLVRLIAAARNILEATN